MVLKLKEENLQSLFFNSQPGVRFFFIWWFINRLMQVKSSQNATNNSEFNYFRIITLQVSDDSQIIYACRNIRYIEFRTLSCVKCF